jgi:ATP:corrinoid adenosyltransferase
LLPLDKLNIMTNEKIAGLDIDFVDACIEELSNDEQVIVSGCTDEKELVEYISEQTGLKIFTSHRGNFLVLNTHK